MQQRIALVAGSLCALLATASHAASISYFLDQTNVDAGSLTDGTNYAQLTIDDDTPGTLHFTVTLLGPLTSIGQSGFGIQDFSFNVIGTNPLQDSADQPSQYTLPSGWSAFVFPPPNQSDGFGRFDVQVGASGSGERASPLSFYLNNTSLTLASFAELSTNNAGQGNVFFSAHIAGFDGPGSIDSGYFGGSTPAPVPLPAALPLLLSGLSGLLVMLRRRLT